MMKKLSLLVTFLVAVLLVPLTIKADTITLTKDFGGAGDLEITNTYTYSFNLSSVQALALSLNSATLSLTHNGNSNNFFGEVWLATSGGNVAIGKLSASSFSNNFVTDSWQLSAAILAEITGQNPWSLTVQLNDNTSGTDKIIIKESGLKVDYTPKTQTSAVPEPSTALLLATGTFATALLRRRNRHSR
jgi:PEP-CTERM motif